MVENDYILRMIHEMLRTIIKLVLGIDINKREKELLEEETQTGKNFRILKGMIEQGQVNEAENLLFEQLDYTNPEDFSMAIMFYLEVNELDTNRLDECNYSREEIIEGIQTIASGFGYEEVISPLIKVL